MRARAFSGATPRLLVSVRSTSSRIRSLQRTSYRPARSSGDDRAPIRQWTRNSGYEGSDRGGISAAVVEAYNNC